MAKGECINETFFKMADGGWSCIWRDIDKREWEIGGILQ